MDKLKVNRLEDVSAARLHYLNEVDNAADVARYVSPSKEIIYQRKLAEARGEIPVDLLAEESKELGIEIDILKSRVLAARKAWEANAFDVELKRIKAKKIIRKATKASEMYEALNVCGFFR